MFRHWFSCLIFCVAFRCSPLMAHEPSDLKVELRSETGSTQFQVGEVIPLEVLLSSTIPNRYLEPCAMFREGNFGFPQCRFFTQWSIDIVPADGWIDLTKFLGPQRVGGPSFEIPSHDLGPEPTKFTYTPEQQVPHRQTRAIHGTPVIQSWAGRRLHAAHAEPTPTGSS